MPSQRQLIRTLESDLDLISTLAVGLAKKTYQGQNTTIKNISRLFMEVNPNLNSEQLQESMGFARTHHCRKYRDSGHPAVSHDYCVGYLLAYWGLETNAVITGILHDILEDSEQKGVSYKINREIRLDITDQINRNFGTEILLSVMALSKPIDPHIIEITQQIDEAIEQNLGANALDRLLRALDQQYSDPKPTELDGMLYEQLEEFKIMYPQIRYFNHTKVADNIHNLLTRQFMRPKGDMTSKQRQQKFCETSEKYVLPLAREIDRSGELEMRLVPYMQELIAR